MLFFCTQASKITDKKVMLIPACKYLVLKEVRNWQLFSLKCYDSDQTQPIKKKNLFIMPANIVCVKE